MKNQIVRIAVLVLVSSATFAFSDRPHVSASAQRAPDAAELAVPTDPSAVGYLDLHKRHPDAEDGAVEFRTSYAAGLAVQRLTQIEGFLKSFARLTERVRTVVTPDELRSFGNTGADMQTIGFHNIPLIVEGTLLKQDYQLRQLEYELAQMKHAQGEMTTAQVDAARGAYADATKRFQLFWDTKLPTD
jgi:hypothetical protein